MIELLTEHLADMRAISPPESVHALEPAGLSGARLFFVTAREDHRLLGCGALKDLATGDGEIKSMRTSTHARGRGVATALLTSLIHEARQRGFGTVLLETGREEYFAAARAMYAKFGFEPCGPFDSYTDDPNSVYFALTL